MLDDKLIKLMSGLLPQVLSFKSSTDTLLSDFFKNHKYLKKNERNIVVMVIYGVLRHYYTITSMVTKNDYLSMLGLSILQLPINTPEIHASIKSINFLALEQLVKPNSLESKAELPKWIIEQLRLKYSEEEVIKLGQSLQQQACLDLSVNTAKTSVKPVLKALTDLGLAAKQMQYSAFGVRLLDKISLSKSTLFNDGLIEIQDESSQLGGMLLGVKRGDMVADFCAGSGGKTPLFGMLMRNIGRIYAFDINESRLNNLLPRLRRSGLSNIYPELIAHENDVKLQRLYGKMDRVFVDAPCTGLGTLRRNPDLKFYNNLADLEKITVKQLNILTAASKLVRSGGYLVYATCSILNAENEEVVKKFLQNNSDFRLISAKSALAKIKLEFIDDDFLILLPHIHGTDGFFASLLQKC